MRYLCIILIMLFFASCDEHFEAEELYGYYAPVGYKNTFDTIQLKSDSVYHRKVYDKDNRLVLEMNGNWKFKNKHRIMFDKFYLNLDDSLIKFPHLVSDTGMEMDTYFETRNGVIGFCVGYFENENCYRKVR